MPAEITRAGLSTAMAGARRITWRKRATPRDDFGRRFIVHLDRNTFDPVGQFERDFVEGFPVPDHYLSIPAGEPWRVLIDFERWAADLQLAHEDYKRRLQATMQRLYGADAVDKTPTKEAIKQAGSAPPPIELVLLYAAGDPWCLGRRPEPTRAVEAVLKSPELYQRYVLKKLPSRRAKGEVDVRETGLQLPSRLAKLLEEDGRVQRIGDPAAQREALWRQSVTEVRVDEDGDAINPEG